MSKNVEYIDNSQKVIKGIDSKLSIANKKILLNIQRDVVESFTKNFSGSDVPISGSGVSATGKGGGHLRQSIRSKTTGKGAGEVSANKHYAVYVEYGTVKMQPRPFFRKGVKDSEKENMAILQRELKKVK